MAIHKLLAEHKEFSFPAAAAFVRLLESSIKLKNIHHVSAAWALEPCRCDLRPHIRFLPYNPFYLHKFAKVLASYVLDGDIVAFGQIFEPDLEVNYFLSYVELLHGSFCSLDSIFRKIKNICCQFRV